MSIRDLIISALADGKVGPVREALESCDENLNGYKDGFTVLHFLLDEASMYSDERPEGLEDTVIAIMDMLVAAGADIHMQTQRKRYRRIWHLTQNTLHMAVRDAWEKIAKRIIELGIDVNQGDNQQVTPLVIAVMGRNVHTRRVSERVAIIKALEEAGASPHVKDCMGNNLDTVISEVYCGGFEIQRAYATLRYNNSHIGLAARRQSAAHSGLRVPIHCSFTKSLNNKDRINSADRITIAALTAKTETLPDDDIDNGNHSTSGPNKKKLSR